MNKFSTAAHAAAVALLPISRVDKAVEPTRKLHAARSAVALAKQVLPALEKITKAASYKVRLATPMLQRLAFLQMGTSCLGTWHLPQEVLRGERGALWRCSRPDVPPPGTPVGGVALRAQGAPAVDTGYTDGVQGVNRVRRGRKLWVPRARTAVRGVVSLSPR